jgi:hypothetical protein
MSKTYEVLNGYATPNGTKKYVDYAIQKGKPATHFRVFEDLTEEKRIYGSERVPTPS